MLNKNHSVEIVLIYVWIGFVCGISFLEASLKFQAPGVTLPIGLGIGRIIFHALNKTEWVFAVILICDILLIKKHKVASNFSLFLIPLIILIVQTSWLLPALDKRAEMIINGISVPASNLHYYYICAEFIKVASLFAFGITLFKINVNESGYHYQGNYREI